MKEPDREWMSAAEYGRLTGLSGAAVAMRLLRGALKTDMYITMPSGHTLPVFSYNRPELAGIVTVRN